MGSSAAQVELNPIDAECHSQLLEDWLHMPHVSKWWGDPMTTFSQLLDHPSDRCAIIQIRDQPVGFLCWQTLPLKEIDEAGLIGLPDRLIDVDIFIGETDAIGQGIGPRAIHLLAERLRRDHQAHFLGMATSVENHSAIRAFEKAGLRPFRDFDDPEIGPARYLILDLDAPPLTDGG